MKVWHRKQQAPERRSKEEANKETYKSPIVPELNIHIFLDIKLDKESSTSRCDLKYNASHSFWQGSDN